MQKKNHESNLSYIWPMNRRNVVESPEAQTSFALIFNPFSPIPPRGEFCQDSLCGLFKTVKSVAKRMSHVSQTLLFN